MEKNKSIDGLVSRHSNNKKSTVKKSVKKAPAKKSTPQKNILKKPAAPQKLEPKPSVEDFLEPVKAFDFNEGDKDFKISKKSKKHKKDFQKPTTKTKKPASKLRKTITIIALIITVTLIGGLIWLLVWGNDIIAKITGGQGNIFDLLTFTTETYEPLATDANGRTNILAFGTSGYNMDGDVGGGVHDGAALTDSIMVISLNQETGDIAMVSLPRDLKASPTCTATSKINEVYWCNNIDGTNEQAGAEALMNEVSSILGLDFQYYAHINWGSLVQIVDILGSIKVTLDEDIYDPYYTGAVFESGIEYTLNGEQALGLARARHGTVSGDFSRGASQQKILIGIKNRLIEKNLNITELLSLASTLGDNLRTNFSVENLKTLAHLTSEFDLNQVRQLSLLDPEPLMTTGNINGISYVLPVGGAGNYKRIKNYIEKMFSSDPRVYEEPSILVLNGTELDGLAASEKYKLIQEGYENIHTDNAPTADYTEQYNIYALNSNKPGTKELLEKYYNLTIKPADELPENIPRDYDFVIIIGNADQ